MQLRINHDSIPKTTDDIINTLLKDRSHGDVEAFLSPPHPSSTTLTDLGITAEELSILLTRLDKVKEDNATIVVYTDYDADGVTGGTILWETLHQLGFKVFPYTPDRVSEGYGFSESGIDTVIHKYNPALIISVDHGITAKAQIAYARDKGVDVIVTDHHHRTDETTPTDTLAIYHIPTICGSAVAYFIAKEIVSHFSKEGKSGDHAQLMRMFTTDYLELAMIGTIADLVPLVGVSRSIAWHGIRQIRQTKRAGILAITHSAGLTPESLSIRDVGYVIAPRINAAGRLTHAIDSIRLLCTHNQERALLLATQAEDVNRQRQDIIKTATEEAIAQVDAQDELPRLLIIKSEVWPEGVIGLIAARLMDKYYRPTIVLTKNGDTYKASCRSTRDFHITEFLTRLAPLLLRYGGHAAAAGFSIESTKLDQFINEASALATELIHDDMLERSIDIDMPIPLSLTTLELADQLSILEPYGVGNKTPVFVSDAIITSSRTMGREGNHLRLDMSPIGKEELFEFVWFKYDKNYLDELNKHEVQVIYTIEKNEWKGVKSVSRKIMHVQKRLYVRS